MTEHEFVTVQVRTRNPEHYLLLNCADGTRWLVRDGHWSQVELPRVEGADRLFDVGGELFTQADLEAARAQGFMRGFTSAVDLMEGGASPEEVRDAIAARLSARESK